MENLQVGQVLEFEVYGTQLKGKFVSRDAKDNKVIKIEVISDSTGASEMGSTCNVHQSFLKQ